ncbi:MAG: class I SAM-dependent methyltransferase [Candidatus Zixiibacteriota bacterium]
MNEQPSGLKPAPEPTKHNPYLHDLIWKLLEENSPGHLLDLPAGPGYFARQAARSGFTSVAGEIDESLYLFDDVKYEPVDMAQKFPFDSASFDYVVSIEGIEHIENQFLFLRECARILKRGGKLLLTTPNVSTLESRFFFFLTEFHDHPPRPIRDDLSNIFMEHINLIPFHRLETFVRFAGFEIGKLTTHRMRKGSRALYPLVYPFARSRYRRAFNRLYRDKPDAERYWKIYQMYLSREVMCGSHHVIVAVKS